MDLLTASRFNDIEKVESLLRNGININMTNSCHQTALYMACRYGHDELAEKLLVAHADPELGYKPLIAAAKYGRRKCIELLLNNRINVNSTDKDGRSALLTACTQRDYATMELLVEFGADVNIRFKNATEERCLAEVMFSNAGRDQINLVEKLLDKGMLLQPGSPALLAASYYAFKYGFRDLGLKMVELDTEKSLQNCYRFALIACAQYNWPDVASRLVDRGVDINCGSNDETALYVACREEHPDVVEVLLKRGADPHLCPEYAELCQNVPPLEMAAAFGNTTIVRMLLSKGISTTPPRRSHGYLRNNAFQVAVVAGNYELGQLLLDTHVAAVNCTDRERRTALHRAAQSCNIEAVKWLIKQQADVNAVDRWNYTALHFACGLCDGHQKTVSTSADDVARLAVVKILLENAADLNAVSRKRSPRAAVTALLIAAGNGLVDVVATLLAAGARQNVRLNSHPPLLAACKKGHFAVVRLLLANGADCNTRSHPILPTPLYTAITSRRCDLVELLLDHGASVNEIHGDGPYPPIISTAFIPLIAMVELLAEYEKNRSSECRTPSATWSDSKDSCWRLFMRMLGTVRDINIIGDTDGGTAFHRACSLGLTDVARELLQRGASINKLTCAEKSALFLACSEGHEDTARFLLSNNANIKTIHSKQGVYYWPLIMAAASGDSLPIVKMLLSYPNVDVNEQSDNGEAAIHAARSRLVAECLLAAGADPTITANFEKTPLDAACEGGHAGVVEALLCAGVNPNKNGNRRAPLFVAIEKGYLDVAKVLLAHGADSDLSGCNYGDRISSLLCYSCDRGNLAAVRMLLEAGASVNIATENKRTPVHCALCPASSSLTLLPERLQIIDLLLEYGADLNAVDDQKETALYTASLLGLKDVVVKLLEYGADLDLISRLKLKNPLAAACQCGNYDIAALLLSRCTADINKPSELDPPTTCLGLAARLAHPDLVNLLLKYGADATLSDNSSLNTPLHFAVDGNKGNTTDIEKVVKALLAASVDVNAVNASSETPLLVACSRSSSTRIVELLLVGGADTKKIPDDVLVKIACRPGGMALFELLIAHGADVNARDSQQRTVLHHLLRNCSFNKRTRSAMTRWSKHPRRKMPRRPTLENLLSNVTFLTVVRIDMNAVDCKHRTALYLALKFSMFEIARLLLSCGADPNASKNRNIPLSLACQMSNDKMVRLLLDYGALPNVEPELDSSRFIFDTSTYPLIAVILELSSLHRMKNRFDNEADTVVEDSSGHGRTAQFYVDTRCLIRDEIISVGELIKSIVDHGADVNIVSSHGEYRALAPLHVACICDLPYVTELLLSRGADVNQQNTRVRPLLVACRKSSLKIIEILLKNGASPNLPSSYRDSSLLFLPSYSFKHIFKHLTCEDAEGLLPLCVATFTGNYEVVRLLLNYGSEIDAIDRVTGFSALHAAVTGIGRQRPISLLANHLKVIAILLDNGADVNLTDGNGETALFKAAANGRIEVIDQLLLSGADPNLKSSTTYIKCDKCDGDHTYKLQIELDMFSRKCHSIVQNTPRANGPSLPLGRAASDGLVDVVQSLLRHGVDVDKRDNVGLTALQHACNHLEFAFVVPITGLVRLFRCIKLLLEGGANANILDPFSRSVLGILLSHDGPIRQHSYVNTNTTFAALIRLLVQHGSRIDDWPPNFPSPPLSRDVVRLQDFLLVNIRFWNFIVELIKAGVGFHVLWLCCKVLSDNEFSASSVTTTVISRAVILSGYRITRAEMTTLQMAEVARWRSVGSEQNERARSRNSAKVRLLDIVNEHRPLSLAALSRVVIRRQLSVANGHRDIRPHVDLLPLPISLKRLLLFEGDLTDVNLSIPARVQHYAVDTFDVDVDRVNDGIHHEQDSEETDELESSCTVM